LSKLEKLMHKHILSVDENLLSKIILNYNLEGCSGSGRSKTRHKDEFD
jgi:hypothetical protein